MTLYRAGARRVGGGKAESAHTPVCTISLTVLVTGLRFITMDIRAGIYKPAINSDVSTTRLKQERISMAAHFIEKKTVSRLWYMCGGAPKIGKVHDGWRVAEVNAGVSEKDPDKITIRVCFDNQVARCKTCGQKMPDKPGKD